MTALRAAASRIGCCALFLAFAGFALPDVVLSNAIAGETAPDEVSIGTFKLAPRAEPVRSDRAPPPAKYETASEEPDLPADGSDLKALYEDAVAALREGRRAEAQRLFERLIAEAPDSAAAGQARGHLAGLYTQSPANEQREAGAARADDVEQGPAASQGRGIAVTEALEERFIVEAGDRVFFSVGSAELGARARGVLQAQAKFIKHRPELSATIEGHADDAPLSTEEHGRLSEARGEAVRQRLIEEGVESHRLAVVSLGRDKRVANCADAGCAAQNRRAVTVLYTLRSRSSGNPAGSVPAGATVVSKRSEQLTH